MILIRVFFFANLSLYSVLFLGDLMLAIAIFDALQRVNLCKAVMTNGVPVNACQLFVLLTLPASPPTEKPLQTVHAVLHLHS